MHKLVGKKQSPEHIAKRVAAVLGRTNTAEAIRRMSEAHKGKPSGKRGKHFPQYQGEKSTHWKGGRPNCLTCGKPISYGATHCFHHCGRNHTAQASGSNHPKWKGEDVHIETLHQWIRKNKPKPELCECCGLKPAYDCANISQTYLRDVNDYEWLCRRCHMLKDGRLEAARLRAPYTIKPKEAYELQR